MMIMRIVVQVVPTMVLAPKHTRQGLLTSPPHSDVESEMSTGYATPTGSDRYIQIVV